MTKQDLEALRKNHKLLDEVAAKMKRFVPMGQEDIMTAQHNIKTSIKLLQNALADALIEHRRQNKHNKTSDY